MSAPLRSRVAGIVHTLVSVCVCTSPRDTAGLVKCGGVGKTEKCSHANCRFLLLVR